MELMRYSHNLLSRPLTVETPSRSTTGKIPRPTGKYCPTRLEYWNDCPTQLSQVYISVCRYFVLGSGDMPRLFPPLLELEGLRRRLVHTPLSSEQELERYEQFAVEDHVRDIVLSCASYGLLAMSSVLGMESSSAVIRIHSTKLKFPKWLQANRQVYLIQDLINSVSIVSTATFPPFLQALSINHPISFLLQPLAWDSIRWTYGRPWSSRIKYPQARKRD